jgi:hypothetical protein
MVRKRNIYEEKIYSDSLFKKIKKLLGSADSFLKANKTQKNKIVKALKNLSLQRNTAELFQTVPAGNMKKFRKEFNLFERKMKEYLSKKINRKDSSLMINQIKLTFEVLSKKLFDDGYIKQEKNYTNYLKKLDNNILLNIIIESSMASISYLSKGDSEKDLNFKDNEIDRLTFNNILLSKIVIYFSFCILRDSVYLSQGIEKIYDEINFIVHNEEISSIGCLSNQLINIFVNIFEIESRIISYTNGGVPKNITLIELPNKFMKCHISSTHLPEITEIDVNFEGFQDKMLCSKKIKRGISTVKLSEKTKRILKISQKKKFKINTEAINLFHELDKMPYEEVKNIDCLPFTPISVLKRLEKECEELKLRLNEESLKKISSEYYTIKEKGKFIKNIHEYLSEKINLPIEYILESERHYKLSKEYKKKMNLRKFHNTILEFAKIFDGFPIYFIESFDYRLRMYTYSYMFGRTSGNYKYLVKEYTESKLTNEGYIVMLKAFFNSYQEKYDELIKMCEEGKKITEIMKWADINIDIPDSEIIKLKSFFYKMLLKKEIKKLKGNRMKTGFMIESDQKASSFVLASIIFNDGELAKHCNLNSQENMDPPMQLMRESSKYFEGKVSDKSLNILSTERDLHKYLLMCFLYAQTYMGRRTRMLEYNICEEDASLLANQYIDFINQNFGILTKKKDSFIKIIKFFLKETDAHITIDTIDGSRLSWIMFKTNAKEIVRKFRCEITGKFSSYRAIKYCFNDKDTRKILSGVLASYLHSVDGAIMRLIIEDIYDSSNNYVISHLHDSIQYHPNKFNDVMESIVNVYTNERLKNMVERTLFTNLRSFLTEDKKKKFDILLEEFMNYSEKEVEITREKLNINGMFPLE